MYNLTSVGTCIVGRYTYRRLNTQCILFTLVRISFIIHYMKGDFFKGLNFFKGTQAAKAKNRVMNKLQFSMAIEEEKVGW